MTRLPLALAALLLSPPAQAQELSAVEWLTLGHGACLAGGGSPDDTSLVFNEIGFAEDTEGEDGLIYFVNEAVPDMLVYAADDGSFCHVESLSVGTETASLAFIAFQDSLGLALDHNQSEDGCTQFGIAGGDILATVTSGGNDPFCASDTDSAIRFTFPAI